MLQQNKYLAGAGALTALGTIAPLWVAVEGDLLGAAIIAIPLAYSEPHGGEPRYLRMDISFTIVVLLLVFMIATAIGFAWTGFSRW